jgi:hypothetical protein
MLEYISTTTRDELDANITLRIGYFGLIDAKANK